MADAKVTGERIVYEGDFAAFTVATFTFDGCTFPLHSSVSLLPVLRMAYDARRGDKVSAELLNAAKVCIQDYWPTESDTPHIV